MEKILKNVVGATRVDNLGSGGGGYISEGQSFHTDKGKFFIKVNGKSGAKRMFDGEKASLEAILATDAIRCPKPVAVVDDPAGAGSVFVMEHLDIRGLSKHSAVLGEQLARLHLHNGKLKLKANDAGQQVGRAENSGFINQFGFHTTTCCGYIPQDNTWADDWVSFYARQRLEFQLDMVEKSSRDKEARELWPRLQRQIPRLFQGLDITPALLHGDLWGGNAGELDTCPVVFDAASFYGHHEYDLAIAGMFGGFGREFYRAYHNIIPKAPGFEKRHELYKLFHYLNHWNHFGSGYRGSSLSIMRSLIRD